MPTLYAMHFDSAIGQLTLASSEQGLAYLALPRANGRGFAGWCRTHAQYDEIKQDEGANRLAVEQVSEFLAGDREDFDLRLDLRATPFQLEVYQAVKEIPYGESVAYAEVARRVGRAAAVRAVGAANGANPIPLVIPCHRVVASNGQLQGYAGGLELKRRLLTMESTSHPAQGALL